MSSLFVSASFDQRIESKAFAVACYEMRKEAYARRGQNNPSQIIKQIAESKVFEFMVYNRLIQALPKYVIVTPPSVDLYQDPEFDTDIELKIGNDRLNINIKSQNLESVRKHGHSWVFQKEDKIFETKKNEMLLVGTVDCFVGSIVGIGFVEQFIPHLGPMVVPKMNKTKHAIYYDNGAEVFDPTRKPLVDLILE